MGVGEVSPALVDLHISSGYLVTFLAGHCSHPILCYLANASRRTKKVLQTYYLHYFASSGCSHTCETASKSPFTSAAHKCKCFTAAVAKLQQWWKVTKNVSFSIQAYKSTTYPSEPQSKATSFWEIFIITQNNGLCFYSKIFFLFFAWRVGTWSRATRRRGHNSDLVVAHADGLRQLEYFNTRPEKDQWSTLASLPELCGVDGVAIAGHRTKVISLLFLCFSNS